MTGKRNIKMVLAYDGAGFHGWQIQPNAVTVEETIRNALRQVTREKILIFASGRTDAGVHALGQVINFHIANRIAEPELQAQMSAILPPNIRILETREVPPDFHSRYSAVGKHYRYSIFNYLLPYGFHPDSVMLVPYPIDIDKMRRGSEFMLGSHDFTALSANPGYRVDNPVKTVHSIEIVRDGHYITFDIVGSGFLYKMARCMVAVLVKVGAGKMAPEDIRSIIQSKDRSRSGFTAPPQGLTLVKVNYPNGAC